MRYIQHILIMFALMAGLAACQTTPPSPPPTTTVDAFVPLAINARRLEIIDNWQMPIESPYIGHRATRLPSNVLADWAMRVLQPVGGSGEIIFDISRAAVTRTKLPLQTGVNMLFTDQQNTKIKAEFEVKIMWLQPVGGAQAMAQIAANHAVTIAESASANDVQNAIQQALNGALASLDAQARAELGKINQIILP
jgi:hypothetical protein